MRRNLLSALSFLSCMPIALAQKPAPPKPSDVLIFANGDQLTGKLERIEAGDIVFSSDMAGELKIAVDKVKELRSGAQFALLRKGDKPGKTPTPEGAIAVADGSLTVTPPSNPPVTVPAKDVAYLIDQATFDKQIQP